MFFLDCVTYFCNRCQTIYIPSGQAPWQRACAWQHGNRPAKTLSFKHLVEPVQPNRQSSCSGMQPPRFLAVGRVKGYIQRWKVTANKNAGGVTRLMNSSACWLSFRRRWSDWEVFKSLRGRSINGAVLCHLYISYLRKKCLEWGWCSTGTGCPKRLWRSHP